MKKIYILSAAAALVAFASCTREQLTPEPASRFDENTLVFSLTDAAPATRAAFAETPGRTGGIIDLGQTVDGEPLRLVETVTRLNTLARVASTKGTPATTDNVGNLYGSFLAAAYAGSPEAEVFKVSFTHASGRWVHTFPQNPLNVNPELYLYMNMPEDPNGLTNLTYVTGETRAITFDYVTPDTPANQQDILFSGTTVTKAGYDPQAGFPATFYHALTGVKFSLGNGKSGTVIKKVVLTNVSSSGSASFSPADGSVTWTNLDNPEASYELTVPTTSTIAEGESLSGDEDALTFWLVPQTLSDDAAIEVTFSVGGGADMTFSAKLNEALGETVTWEAGELHTFSLNPTMVDVAIEDTMNDAMTVKSDVVITNTGNIAQFVRVNLIGNWVGERMISENKWSDETVLMGYTSATMEDEVARWNDKDGAHQWVSPTGRSYNYTPFGVFSGLPAKGATVNNWIRRDKYYYYTLAVDPEATIEDELFESYTLEEDNIPDIYIRDNAGNPQKARKVHLVLDVVVQAVSALDADGKPYNTYEAAWKAALGDSANLDDL